MNLIRQYRPWFAYWLLLVFAGQQASQLAYLHVHKLADGTIIVHTHFYNNSCAKNPIQPNNHSLRELTWLAATAHIPFTVSSFAALPVLVGLLLFVGTSSWQGLLLPPHRAIAADGRGPPPCFWPVC